MYQPYINLEPYLWADDFAWNYEWVFRPEQARTFQPQKPLFMADDYAGDITTLGIVTVGGAGTDGHIEFAGDRDWFRVEINQDQIVRFNSNLLDRSQYIRFRIYDDNGAHVAYGGNSDSPSTHSFQEGGTYYIEVFSLSQEDDVAYTLLPMSVADDHLNDTRTTSTISLGETVSGITQYNSDQDWFAFSAQAGQIINFAQVSNDVTGSHRLFIADSAGNQTHGSYYGAENLAFVVPQNSTYYVVFDASPNTTNGTGSFSITASELFDDYADDITTTGVITIDGDATTGRLDYADDLDMFAVTIAAGQQITFTLTPSVQNSYGSALVIFSQAGEHLTQGSGVGATVTSGYSFDAAGTYFIGVNTGPLLDNMDYSIAASIFNGDDYSSDDTTTGLLALDGTSVLGEIELSNDKDWLRFEVGQDNIVDFLISKTTSSPINNLSFDILDVNGGFIVAGIDLYNRASLNYVFDQPGTYFISVQARQPLETGTYSLSAIAARDLVAGDTSTQAVLVLDAGQINGVINTSFDRDWFQFTVTAPETIVFSASEPDISIPLVVNIYDETGALFLTTGFGRYGTMSLGHQFEQAGTFFIEVTTWTVSQAEDYQLQAVTFADDYSNYDNTDTNIIVGGATIAGTVDYTGDIDRFNLAIDAPQNVEFTLTYPSGETNGLVLIIFDDDGNIISSWHGWSGFQAVFAFETAGNYQIGIVSRDNNSGQYNTNIGDYNLTASATLDPAMSPISDVYGTLFDDRIMGTDADERIVGDSGNDVLFGGMGDDILRGEYGDDKLYGGLGDDILIGGDNNDILVGGEGNDTLYGYIGADRFVFLANSGVDQISDFEDGIDLIEFGDNAYNFSSLNIYQDGSDVVIKSENGVVTLTNIDISLIDASDFVFRISTDPHTDKKGHKKPVVVDDLDENDGSVILDGAILDQDLVSEFLNQIKTLREMVSLEEAPLDADLDIDVLHNINYFNFL